MRSATGWALGAIVMFGLGGASGAGVPGEHHLLLRPALMKSLGDGFVVQLRISNPERRPVELVLVSVQHLAVWAGATPEEDLANVARARVTPLEPDDAWICGRPGGGDSWSYRMPAWRRDGSALRVLLPYSAADREPRLVWCESDGGCPTDVYDLFLHFPESRPRSTPGMRSRCTALPRRSSTSKPRARAIRSRRPVHAPRRRADRDA